MAAWISTLIPEFRLKEVEKEDVDLLLQLICELAAFENMRDEVTADPSTLRRSLLENGYARALLAYEGREVVGFAVYFYHFSTFEGRAGIYLEDVFLRERYRGKGYGKMILAYLANEAVTKGFARLEWSCLNWNKPAIRFYQGLGARNLCEWRRYRLSGRELWENAEYFKGRSPQGSVD